MKSMTGFGQGKRVTDDYTVTVDIRTVNHRFLDFHIRIPQTYMALETKIKNLIKEHVSRGRVDCFVTVQLFNNYNRKLQIDWDLIDEYYRFLQEVQDKYQFKEEIQITHLLDKDELVQIAEIEEENDEIGKIILEVTKEAVIQLADMRKTEGDRLKNDLVSFITTLERQIDEVRTLAPRASKEYEEKLAKKLAEYTAGVIDEVRLMTEVAIFAEKVDIQEEITRLDSHIDQFQQLLNSQMEEPMGRKMDFLIQEMNREVNTIGAKTSDVAISRYVVEMKSVLEKMKEQVQNIE